MLYRFITPHKYCVLLCCLASQAHGASTTMPLDPIVVSATRTERSQHDAPIRTELISAKEAQRLHARNLKEALENIPGLQIREIHGKSGYEVTLQGLSSDQVLVLIDGLPVASSTGSTMDLSQYAIGNIEHIEVIKGAASAQYGSSAMGGVINIITRSAQPGVRGRLAYDGGSYGKQNISTRQSSLAQHHTQAQLEAGNSVWRSKFTLDTRNNKGFTVDPKQWQREGDNTARTQWDAQLSWHPTERRFIRTELQRFEEEDTQWLAPEFMPPNRLFPNKKETIKRDRFAVLAGWDWGQMRFTAKGLDESYRSHSYKTNNIAAHPYDKRNMALATQFLSLQWDYPLFANHLAQVGVDVRRESLEQFNNGVSELGQSGRAKRQNNELFLQDDYFINDNHEVVLGVRAQQDSNFGSHISPKLAYKYHWFATQRQQAVLRASVGTGYRVPNLKERYFTFDHSSIGYQVLGNPNLAPESSISYQLGAWWQHHNSTLDINAFYNRISDLIQTDMENFKTVEGIAIYSYLNIASARTYGVEASYEQQLLAQLNAVMAYTYTEAEDTTKRQTLTRRPKHISRAGLDWHIIPTLEASVRIRHQSKELASTTPLAYSPSWLTTDLKLNYWPYPNTRLFAGVNNLFNQQRDFASGTDFSSIEGRFVYLGLQLDINL